MKQINLKQNISLTFEDNLQDSMKQRKNILKISNQAEIYYLNSDLILYVEADGNYCDIHLTDGDVLKTVGFQRAEVARMIDTQLLTEDASKFALVGKHFLVNITHIQYINASQQQLIFDVNHFSTCQKKAIKISVNALRNLRLSLDEVVVIAPKTYNSLSATNNGFVNHIMTKPVFKNYDIDEDEVMILG